MHPSNTFPFHRLFALGSISLVLFALAACGDDPEGQNDGDIGEAPDVVFELDAYNYHYTHQGESEQNPELVVDEGDLVEVEMCIEGGNHDWVVDEFDGAQTEIISSGCDTVQFTAETAGSFDYYCSVGSHRAQGMEGTLTVE